MGIPLPPIEVGDILPTSDEIHFLPIYDADGEQVNKSNDIIPIYGDSVAYSDTQISICRDNKVVFTCSPSLVYYVCKN